MPAQKRHKTNYPGVYFIVGKAIGTGKPENIYYIMYRKIGKDGKLHQTHEKAGRQFQDDMTPAKAANIRVKRIGGEQLSNKEKRDFEVQQKKAEASKWTVDRLWEEYKKQRPDSKSLKVDQGRYDIYLKDGFGSKEPKDVIQLEVHRLRVNLLKKRKPQTVKHILALLKRIMKFGEDKGLCQGAGFKVELPKVSNQKIEDLTPDQLTSLLEAIEKDTNVQAGNLMKMILFTGIRRSECFRLKWKHINYETGFIKLEAPKGGVDQKIPLNNEARQLLDNHPRTKSEFVFPGRGGNQRTDIKHQVNRIKEAAGLPKDFRALHGLRHVYASMLASSGKVDMYTLQKLLTHKGPQMTQRYAHLRDESLKSASDLAGEIIGEAMKKTDDKNVIEINNNKH